MAKRDIKIAVIGSGAAGLTAAYLLGKEHRVTLFERSEALGGHIHTVSVPEGPNRSTAVDIGFIVYNEKQYPLFSRLLKELEIQSLETSISFSYGNWQENFVYCTPGPESLPYLLKPSFYRILGEALKFKAKAQKDLRTGALGDQTLETYLEESKFSPSFIRSYLIPLGAAIWLVPPKLMLGFPAELFLRFWERHGLLSWRLPQGWRVIQGGSSAYVEAFKKRFRGEIKNRVEIESIRRTDEKVIIKEVQGFENLFDYVVIATHADEALNLLEDPTQEERRLLGGWLYVKNHAILHMDEKLMPQKKRAWAAWNASVETGGDDFGALSLTWYLNRIQKLKSAHSYFMTMNHTAPVDPSKVIKEIDYRHPLYTLENYRAQKELKKLNVPSGRTYFCGSYFGFGLHEDAVQSAVDALQSFCVNL